jgi:CRP-like cAMP-binding protein
MPEDEIKALASKARNAEFQKGELFVKEGGTCQRLLFIHRGLFRYYILHEGRDITKDFAVDAQNPFCTAYTSFMLQKPSEIWIEALECCQVLAWDKPDILPLFQEHPAWLRFSKMMADRLFYRKEQREIELLKCTAEERYRHFLADFPGLSQRVSQYHIATYLGITPESLSRIRSRLAKNS